MMSDKDSIAALNRIIDLQTETISIQKETIRALQTTLYYNPRATVTMGCPCSSCAKARGEDGFWSHTTRRTE
jgi:hypothetical protein